ncbi:MAG: hypothetical protein WCE75_15690, partial [Terracidiphilus sp.]
MHNSHRFAQFSLLGLLVSLVFAPVLAAQLVTGEVPRPAPMQATRIATGLTAANGSETLEVTVCGSG